MITDEFPCESIDNDYRGLLGAHQMDNMEDPPCPECGQPDNCGDCNHTPVLCEHGLSLWLCMGPNHYPTMDDEMNGRYY